MSKVYARLNIDLELDEKSISGTQLDLLGLARLVKHDLEKTPRPGPPLRVLSVYSPTKDWEIAAQLVLDEPFISSDDERGNPDRRAHSRACGVKKHDHGSDCHPNCPTCGGGRFPDAMS